MIPIRTSILWPASCWPRSLVLTGCGGTDGAGGRRDTTLTLVAYSTPREVYEELIPAFTATPAGAGVSFEQSYAASGEQSRAVESGLPASVVAFSLAPDVTRLVEADLVEPDWADDEHKGMVSNSVVVLAVRKGNPKGIKGWSDLLRDDIEVITPNPFTSGRRAMERHGRVRRPTRAGQVERGGGRVPPPALPQRPRAGQERARVPADLRGRQGRRADRVRERGDHRPAEGRGTRLRDPRRDDPDREPDRGRLGGRTRSTQEKAQAFIDYARSEPGQKVFAEKGYRSILPELVEADRYPEPESLFTIEKFGGWEKVMADFFDREDGIMAEIERELGAPLE